MLYLVSRKTKSEMAKLLYQFFGLHVTPRRKRAGFQMKDAIQLKSSQRIYILYLLCLMRKETLLAASGGGGVLPRPYNGLYGEAPPERGYLFQASGI